jgi:hypothetical protein
MILMVMIIMTVISVFTIMMIVNYFTLVTVNNSSQERILNINSNLG